jgi:hypothetical protein
MIKLREAIEKKKLEFDDAIRGASTDNVALELLRDKRRFLCQNDLFYLCGLTGNDKITQYPDYYQPFCDEVSLMNWKIVRLGMHKPDMYMLPIEAVSDDPAKDFEAMQRLYLCYRTFYKTTIVTKVHSLQLLLNFPNIHIVLCHNKQENSSDNLVSIKNCFLTTDLRYLYPKYIPKTKDWGNMSGFSVAFRTDKNRSEENIEAVGVDTEITGRHYQVAKKNDLVTEKSVNTEEQLKKTLDWDNRFNQGMFDDPQVTLQDYEGTRYHFSDLYSAKLNDPRIKIMEYSLLKDKNPDNITQDNIANPGRFSIEGVKDMKKDPWVFNCQMLLKPDDPSKMQFKKEMISYFTQIPQGANFYLLVDPASRRKKRSDWTVMLVVALAWYDGRVCKFIVDGVRDKLDPKQRVDMAIALARKWSIKGCGWEAIGFQETDCFYLEEVRRKEKMFFSIEQIDSHKVSKEDRIRSLMPDYAQHNWLWPQKGVIERMSFVDGRKFDLTTEMEFEMTQFPLCEHDDLLDTMAFINRVSVVNPQEIKTVEDRHEMTFGEYAKIKDERLSMCNRNPWAKLTARV